MTHRDSRDTGTIRKPAKLLSTTSRSKGTLRHLYRVLLFAAVVVLVATSLWAQQVTSDAAWEGDFGLEIPVGRNCAVDEIVIGPLPETISGEFLACVRIEASGVEVVGPERTVFRAGQEIVLGDGFRIADDTSFAASIEPAIAGDFFTEGREFPQRHGRLWSATDVVHAAGPGFG